MERNNKRYIFSSSISLINPYRFYILSYYAWYVVQRNNKWLQLHATRSNKRANFEYATSFMSDWPIHINRIEIDAASASSYGCRKSSERMKWVLPAGDFPVASEKLSRDWMIDQDARSKKLKLNWLPILLQRYSNSFPWRDQIAFGFRQRFCGFLETIDWFYNSESIEFAKTLTFRTSSFGSTK